MNATLQQLGRYQLQERLGQNKWGEVWKAYDMRNRRPVAVKLLHTKASWEPTEQRQIEELAAELAQIHHANIVQMHRVQLLPVPNSDMTLLCTVSDYVEGVTLADYIRALPRTGRALPGPELLHIFACLASAIEYAHQHGLVHGDLKPGNIILHPVEHEEQAFEPVITDFGQAQLLEALPGGSQGKRSLNSMYYFSPEQASGLPATQQSDIYALGIMLYEICTGVVPFQGVRPVALVMQHVNSAPPAPQMLNPNIPLSVTQVIMRCLAKDPARRYQSVGALVVALAKALNIPLPQRFNHLGYTIEELPEEVSNHSIDPFGLPVAVTGAFQRSRESDYRRFRPSQRRTVVYTLLTTMLLISFVAVGFGLYAQLSKPAPPPGPVGHAYFTSSERTMANTIEEANNNEVQIDLSSIPQPATGNSYYAWLLADKDQEEAPPVYLGKLVVEQGKVSFRYKGGARNSDLLSSMSRFLITEESDALTPTLPAPDQTTWRYYAELPQFLNPDDAHHADTLAHFRHLMTHAPELQAKKITGGLVPWFLHNTQAIAALGQQAKEAWTKQDMTRTRATLIELLSYLDGREIIKQDLPAGLVANVANRMELQVPVLGRNPQDTAPTDYERTAPSGYVYLIGLHLSGALALNAPPEQRKSASEINTALNQEVQWLVTLHKEVKSLLGRSDEQLGEKEAGDTLSHIADLALMSYKGIPGSAEEQTGGSIWIYENVQRLANFAVKPYTSKS